MTKNIHPVQDSAGEQHPWRRYSLNRVSLKLTNTLFMGPSSPFISNRSRSSESPKRYINVTALSWFTVPNSIQFKQNTFFSKD